jgi:hypothetical protein
MSLMENMFWFDFFESEVQFWHENISDFQNNVIFRLRPFSYKVLNYIE